LLSNALTKLPALSPEGRPNSYAQSKLAVPKFCVLGALPAKRRLPAMPAAAARRLSMVRHSGAINCIVCKNIAKFARNFKRTAPEGAAGKKAGGTPAGAWFFFMQKSFFAGK
jgi:hypothetical protein